MSKTYPCDFVDGDGLWWVIFQGHDVGEAVIESEITKSLGPKMADQKLHVQKQWLHYNPRVKWCERYDGWGCDQQGEWHGHWFEVRPNPKAPDSQFTLARWKVPETTNEETN